MIMRRTHCRFCKKELDVGYCLPNCPYHYTANSDGWDFYTGKYWVDVYHSYSNIYYKIEGITMRYPFINNRGATAGLHNLNGKIAELPFQILPDASEDDIAVYLTFT
jgi:hypothetical protein